MAVPGGEDVYATLLLTDSYLPGALVLAHSLRDAGTTRKLAVLVTLDTVSVEVVSQLKAVYDYVLPVNRIRNDSPANLYLMDRPDLHSAFTKINLWKQTQFRKIVYIDADVVAYRAPNELFDLPHAFSAAPDIGWPDLFNTGVMVLTPDMGEFYALLAMAERGISFDGADQGLLNMHFKNNYNRLSFTYNVTPSAHYQYIPAYRHFQSSINMVHFIGADKPWKQGRDAHTGSGPFNEMVGRWWAVYDRHYRKETPPASSATSGAPAGSAQSGQSGEQPPELVQYFVEGEYQPKVQYVVPVGEPRHDDTGGSHGQHYEHPPPRLTPFEQSHPFEQASQHHQEHHDFSRFHHHEHEHAHLENVHYPPHTSPTEDRHEQSHDGHHHHHHHHHPPSESFPTSQGPHTEARSEQEHPHQHRDPYPEPEPKPEPPQQPSWDAQREPPPPDSKPEAMNFPQTHYEMSSDTAPFVPPPRYPSPPRDMWFEIPKERPAPPTTKPKAIFPWETHQPRASRVFADMQPEPEHEPAAAQEETPAAASGERKDSTDSRTQAESSFTEASTVEAKSEPATPATQGSQISPADPWSSFPRTNAWDDVPEIERYVEGLQQKHRRTKSQGMKLGGLSASDLTQEDVWHRRGSKLTDFPSEVERPSLPVTPAPIRRPKFWGGGALGFGADDDEGDGDEQLPTAEGVPAQSEWDPLAQLQRLAEQQAELLRQKIGGSGDAGEGKNDSGLVIGVEGREIPRRELPFGSEDARSPTYVAQSANVLSPKPVKPSSGASAVRNLMQGGEARSVPRTTPGGGGGNSSNIPEPSYHGPGVAFEKDEDFLTQDTAAPPTEEELDVLDT